MRTRSGEELVRRYRAGDGEALASLLAACEGLLAARIRARLPAAVRRKVSVSDVLQETTIVAFDRRADFRGDDARAFRNWVVGIAEHKALAALRRFGGTAKRNAFQEASTGARTSPRQAEARTPSPSQAAIERELREVAREAMATLPERYREVLRLAREEELPLREVAERMGTSREAAKKLYGRALRLFTDAFEGRRRGAP